MGRGRSLPFYTVLREGLIEKAISEPISEGSKRVSHRNIQVHCRQKVQQLQRPYESRLLCLRNSEEASVPGTVAEKGGVVENEVRERMRMRQVVGERCVLCGDHVGL